MRVLMLLNLDMPGNEDIDDESERKERDMGDEYAAIDGLTSVDMTEEMKEVLDRYYIGGVDITVSDALVIIPPKDRRRNPRFHASRWYGQVVQDV